MKNSQLLTPDEVSILLKVPKATLKIWRHRASSGGKKIIPFVKLGRLVRYRKADIDALLAPQNVHDAENENRSPL